MRSASTSRARNPGVGCCQNDERARLDVTRWQFWDLAHWDPACATFVFEYVVKPVVLANGEPDMVAIARGTEERFSGCRGDR